MPDTLLNPGLNSATPLGSSSPSGMTPAEIRQAYGISQISFNGTAGIGSGETIAIVDAFNDPTIQTDLQTFDKSFGLPNPTLTVVDEDGGSSLPAANSNWIPEIALDVEWAHAAAPGANILLVEAGTSSYSNLMQAVSYAADQPGVVAVSMSWGGGEWSSENLYDSYLETPTGHAGVVFAAASGDAGAPVEYPAISPNVLSVGGTTLNIGSAGNYISESGWAGSGGGISQYEAPPSFQTGVVTQSSTFRTNPDVAFNADPNSGYSVCDSYDNGTSTPWVAYGGTSAAAPQWAGLIAIADQGRALAGESSFSNTTLMPELYQLPSSAFHDITTGSSDGSPSYSAGPGYDLVTGLGSPVANVLVSELVGQTLPSATHFSITSSANITAGSGLSITVTALDAQNQAVSDYTGTIQLSSTDGLAGLPANYSFTSGDDGSHTFTVTLKTAGSQTITATSTSNNSITGSDPVTVNPAAVAALSVSGPSTITAGSSFSETTTALDAFGNVVTGYAGTIQFSSTDIAAGLPASYTFTSSDNGKHTFTITLKTAGGQKVTVTDTGNNSLQAGLSVSVTPSTISSFRVSIPTSTTAGANLNETVTALDAYGNAIANYSGTVEFSSTDVAASLPANYTFTSADDGSHTFSITLKTDGAQTVSVTDVSATSATATSSLSVSPDAVNKLIFTGPSSGTAGTSLTETLTAEDAYGNVETGYVGTVVWSSSDTRAELPAKYTFTASDAGSHTFTIMLKTAGSQTITATDASNSALTVTSAVSVSAGAIASFSLSGPSTATAGTSFNETITAFDACGNVASGYTGTLNFTSSDSAASLPSSYTFTASDAGSHTFTITLKSAGKQMITASDTSNSALTLAASVSVSAGTSSSLTISDPLYETAGISFPETVTALDAYGNTVTNYTGTVHFTSTDPAAQLPSNYTFTTADNGSYSFMVTLDTVGSQSITATDIADTSLQYSLPVNVVPGAASQLKVSAPNSVAAGTAFDETVTALDAEGNVVTGYTGTMHFASSDSAAGLPSSYTFTSADAGSHTFAITLKTAGSESVTVSDASNSQLTATSNIGVAAASVSRLAVTGPATTTLGMSFVEGVTAEDAYGNIATGFTGTVQFASTDMQADLPASYTFTPSDAGSHTFSVTLYTASTQSVSATVTANSSITGSVSILVSPLGSEWFKVTAPSTVTAGTSETFTVAAMNGNGSEATGYRGEITFTTSAKSAVLPATYTFTAADAGKHTFTIDLKTAGDQSITVASKGAPAMKASTTVDVAAAAASTFKLSGPSSAVAGTTFDDTITALDPYGNVATSFTGSLAFTSSDHAASLPLSVAFSASDNGILNFLAALKTEGAQTISVSNISNGSITEKAAVSVKAAALSSFRVSGFPASTTAGRKASFTIAALDAYGNVVTGYTGTVKFTSADHNAVLPAATTLTRGIGSFAATFKTAGAQTLSVSDEKTGATGEESGIIVNPAAAAKLLFIQQPTAVLPGANFSPVVIVAVVDQYNNVVATDQDAVIALALHGGSTGSKLSGNSAEVVNGIATFTDLVVSKAGTDYTLSATSGPLTAASSVDFTVL